MKGINKASQKVKGSPKGLIPKVFKTTNMALGSHFLSPLKPIASFGLGISIL